MKSEGDRYHLFRYRRLTKERLEGCATPTMEVPFGPFHDERIVSSSCQTPCTRSGAKENQLMKHSMREAPGIISHTARFVNIISFSSPPFPPLLFPSPKSRPEKGRARAGRIIEFDFPAFSICPHHDEREGGKREREAKFVRMALAAVSAASNQSGRGWMWPSINPEVAKSWPPPRPLPTF